ncbi:MAG: tetratricopeptide repeat protein, partial [Deltaproteobacteria bacterium]|nr:tetratricopeptide repeat protein [Deltaproteobacteria bacterium]
MTLLIYSNTFLTPFQFDDESNIIDNAEIRSLGNFLDFSGTRFVCFLTFALNYRFGGLNVFGYHLVNLLIHITNGFLVYSLILLLIRAVQGPPTPPASQSASAPFIALATALLFIAHPIQTQAVTYIVQRLASLVTLFYLLAVVGYLKWRLSPSEAGTRSLWYAVSLVSCVLAMKTKENSFTLPLMILLMERVFFKPLRWKAILPFFLLAAPIIPLSHQNALGEAEGFARDTTEIGRSDYLFTQFRVIVTYLRLLVLPINQRLDYDYPIYHSFFQPAVFIPFLFLLGLFVFAIRHIGRIGPI